MRIARHCWPELRNWNASYPNNQRGRQQSSRLENPLNLTEYATTSESCCGSRKWTPKSRSNRAPDPSRRETSFLSPNPFSKRQHDDTTTLKSNKTARSPRTRILKHGCANFTHRVTSSQNTEKPIAIVVNEKTKEWKSITFDLPKSFTEWTRPQRNPCKSLIL